MKVLKDEIYESILSVARQEFLRKGYKEASMRNIAQKANVGLSNIYNYFKNKGEIYKTVVNPAKSHICKLRGRQGLFPFFVNLNRTLFANKQG